MPGEEMQSLRSFLASLPTMAESSIEETRLLYEQIGQNFPLPEGTRVTPVVTDAVAGEWVRAPEAATDKIIFYLHGGGYILGSPLSHRHLVTALSQASGATAFVLDYPLAPEIPHPAAVTCAVAAYTWLLHEGIQAGRIAIAGDSAGGGLMVATMVQLRNEGLPLPACGVCISPWVDLTNSAESYISKASADPMLTRENLNLMAQAYLQGQDPQTPLASPLYADLRGLPPLLIHVGTEEVLLDDATCLERRAREAGVDVKLEVWDEMIHVWHFFYPMLAEGRKAIDRLGDFIKANISH